MTLLGHAFGRSQRLVALAGLTVVVSGCGQSAPAISTSASAQLTSDVTRLQRAATSGTTTELGRAAETLRTDVAAQRVAGNLSADRSAAILDQLARVLLDAADRPAPTVVASSPAPSAATGHGKGKGKGEGTGDGNGDGNGGGD